MSWFPQDYPVKTSQNQNVPSDLPKRPIFGESKRPKYIFTIFNQIRGSKHFLWTHWSKCPKVKSPQVKTSQSQNVPSQNVPESKRPKSKRPKVKTSQVKTSHSQNIPESKRPKLKCPKSKRPKVKTSHLVCLPVNNITHTVMKFLVYTSNMLYYSDNLLSTSLWNHEPEPWSENKINGNI